MFADNPTYHYLSPSSRTTSRNNIKPRCTILPKLLARMRTSIHMYSPPFSATISIPTTAKAIMARSHSKRPYPSLAFFSPSSSSSSSYAMDIPLKATPSPPSCSSSTSSSYSDSDLLVRSTSSSLSSSPSSITSSNGSFNSVSHPDWPQSDTLSSPSQLAGCQKSCYISDEDLEDLTSLPLWNDVRIPDQHHYGGGYGCGNAQLTAEAYGDSSSTAVEELPPTSLGPAKPQPRKMKSAGGKRRRSKELRRKPLGIMTPISESGESCT